MEGDAGLVRQLLLVEQAAKERLCQGDPTVSPERWEAGRGVGPAPRPRHHAGPRRGQGRAEVVNSVAPQRVWLLWQNEAGRKGRPGRALVAVRSGVAGRPGVAWRTGARLPLRLHTHTHHGQQGLALQHRQEVECGSWR